MNIKKLFLTAVAITAVAVGHAQNAVPLVIAGGPGGLGNLMALAISPTLSKAVDAPVVIEFRPGGTNTVALNHVIKSRTPAFFTGPVHIGGEINQLTQIVPIVNFGPTSAFALARPELGINSLKELLTQNKKKSITMGFPAGSTQQYYVEGLAQYSKNIEIVPVRFKSGGDAVNALIGGHIDTVVINSPLAYIMAKEKNLVGLATIAYERSSYLPSVPTAHEQGIKFDMDIAGFTTFMLWANPDIDPAIVDRTRKKFVAWIKTADGQEFVKKFDLPVKNSTFATPEVELKKMLK